MLNAAKFFPPGRLEVQHGANASKRGKPAASPPDTKSDKPFTGSFLGLRNVLNNCLPPTVEANCGRHEPEAPSSILQPTTWSPRVSASPTPTDADVNPSGDPQYQRSHGGPGKTGTVAQDSDPEGSPSRAGGSKHTTCEIATGSSTP
ncbi:hypothetical protein BDV93DRAFT_510238 [Ceratobasidium sp. AG-I]|nr:hypothetical protein BDV93DRAFT_510238 [Ceratobasidium sp. AG-I]